MTIRKLSTETEERAARRQRVESAIDTTRMHPIDRRDRIARVALAIQRGGGDHLGDVDSIHRELIALLGEAP